MGNASPSSLDQARQAARREMADQLNRAARRLRATETLAQWSGALLEAAGAHCRRAALFAIERDALLFQAARGMEAPTGMEAVPLASAPAFRSAVESKDAIVALRTAGELSASIAAIAGEAPDATVSLFPVVSGGRVAAVLYADGGEVNAGALELLATIAGAILENRSALNRGGLLSIGAPQPIFIHHDEADL